MAGTGISRYLEIKEQILRKISSGEYKVGGYLPSEPRLAEIFHCSRGTIRQALNALEQEGLIARRSGVGTQVLRSSRQPNLLSSSEQILLRGRHPGRQLLFQGTLPASQANPRVLEAFEVDPGQAEQTRLFWIDQLELADDQPVARQDIFLRVNDFVPDAFEGITFEDSEQDFFSNAGRRVKWVDETIRARPPSDEEIELLGLQSQPADCRLVYERSSILYDEKNLPLELRVSVERADFFEKYRYRIRAD